LEPVHKPTLAARESYRDIYVIVAPPRSSSTALARVFWESPAIDCYSHEPFDRRYYCKAGYTSVADALEHPHQLPKNGRKATRQNLLIKEMTFQVGADFPTLAALTSRPLTFIVRDPRRCISSRMRKLQEGGEEPLFPTRESGWEDLAQQLAFCDDSTIPYVIVDSADFRSQPAEVLPALFRFLGLSFSSQLLSWQPIADLALGALGAQQRHWYQRVLASGGVQAENDPAPGLDFFPVAGGFRAHVARCCEIYAELKSREQMLKIG
jgi:hypothetical protein